MDRHRALAFLLAVTFSAFAATSGSLAADHREAPAISEDPAAGAVLPTTPGAAEATNPGEHDLIRAWHDSGNPRIPKRDIRPPTPRSQPSSLN